MKNLPAVFVIAPASLETLERDEASGARIFSDVEFVDIREVLIPGNCCELCRHSLGEQS